MAELPTLRSEAARRLGDDLGADLAVPFSTFGGEGALVWFNLTDASYRKGG